MNSMFRIKSIRTYLIAAFILAVLIPAIIGNTYTALNRINTDLTNARSRLGAISTLKSAQIEAYLQGIEEEQATFITTTNDINLVKSSLPGTSDSIRYVSNIRLRDQLRVTLSQREGYQSLSVLDLSGLVLVSTDETLVDQNWGNLQYFQRPRIEAFIEPLISKSPNSVIIITPIRLNDETIAVLASQTTYATINRILLEYSGLGKTGDNFIVDEHGALLSPLRFGPLALGTKISTSAIAKMTTEKRNGTLEYTGTHGQDVVGVYHWFPALKVGIVLEQDRDELLEPTYAAVISNILLTLVAAIAIVILALFIVERNLSRPIIRLANSARRLAEGDLNIRAPKVTQLELGELTDSFNTMAERLQGNIRNLELLNEELETRVELRTRDLEEARKEAENANRIKSQFLANMSHELRTPLNAILNFTAFVADGVMGPINEAQSDALAQSITSSKHLLSLINDILDLTKIEAGLMDLFIQPVDMNEIMGSIVSVGKGLVKDKPIDLIHRIQGELPITHGDKRRLRQVFLNMVSNAVKFTPKGSVTIKANFDNGKFLITVQDTGVGIPKEDYNLVFESFKQAKHDLPETTGTGLGMPISRYFVESHNGKIWFESAVGQGTTFYVELPLLSMEEANQVAHLLVEKS